MVKSTNPLIVTFGAGAGAGAWAKAGGASIPGAAMKKSVAATFLMYSLLMLSELREEPSLTLTPATPAAAPVRRSATLLPHGPNVGQQKNRPPEPGFTRCRRPVKSRI